MLGKLFVSYRADDEGSRYKNLLVGWSENPNKNFFDVKFEDTSIGISINSTNAYYIKRKIKEKIESSNKVICIIGKNTHSSEWVNWELVTAHNLNKPIVAIKIDKSYKSPIEVYGKNVHWAYSFSYEAIKKALLEV
ncbi:TPA: TIR domain-containing protein [Staphylococcus aureus]|nr:TIR domain-containing protein [Staphylococcus aureus]HDE9327332.1 TIR domain-containing protein [Staphylococcus aureus]HDH0856961.1 TIR domain-containing protein [Staphylococcus aureus]HDH5607358.1 TIR domain-containing protein [Staphylococcus aureus]HDH5680782.1 TIR domain-containing protein [Staphylococcus aureus]